LRSWADFCSAVSFASSICLCRVSARCFSVSAFARSATSAFFPGSPRAVHASSVMSAGLAGAALVVVVLSVVVPCVEPGGSAWPVVVSSTIVNPPNRARWVAMIPARSAGNEGMVNGLDMCVLPIAGLVPPPRADRKT